MKALCTLLLISISIVSFGQKKKNRFEDKKEYYHKKMEEFKKNPSAFLPLMTAGVGARFQNFSALNSRMAAFPQYEQLKKHMGTLQLGWLKERQNIIAAGSILAGSSMRNRKSEKSSGVRFLGISADAGYNVLHNKNVMAYPFAGLAVETYQARFFEDHGASGFDNYIGTESYNTDPLKLRNTFFNYRLGVGALLTSEKCMGHSIGIQAGYTGSFAKRGWRTNNNQALSGAPQDRVSQFFVTLILANKMSMSRRK